MSNCNWLQLGLTWAKACFTLNWPQVNWFYFERLLSLSLSLVLFVIQILLQQLVVCVEWVLEDHIIHPINCKQLKKWVWWAWNLKGRCEHQVRRVWSWDERKGRGGRQEQRRREREREGRKKEKIRQRTFGVSGTGGNEFRSSRLQSVLAVNKWPSAVGQTYTKLALPWLMFLCFFKFLFKIQLTSGSRWEGERVLTFYWPLLCHSSLEPCLEVS